MIIFLKPMMLLAIIPAIFIIFSLVSKKFVKFLRKEEREEFNQKTKLIRTYVLISRILAVILIIVAFAEPALLEDKIVQGEPQLKLIVDKSRSMEIFDSTIAGKIKSKLEDENIPVTVLEVGLDNRSSLGTGLLSVARGHDSLLFISDGRNNAGQDISDVMVFASSINSSVNIVKLTPEENDVSVRIDGPSETTIGVSNAFNIVLDHIGQIPNYELIVKLDDQVIYSDTILDEQTIPLERQLSVGYHKMEARINVADYFADNNQYFKVIKVEPKPKVLFLSSQSQLTSFLSDIYDLDTRSIIPLSIDQYLAVIINNQSDVNFGSNQKLAEYVLDGNGVTVIGGKEAFGSGEYQGSAFEGFLPVRVADKQLKRKDISVLIMLDISADTAEAFGDSGVYTKQQVEKAIVLQLLDDLANTDNVGVVAFNNQRFEISSFSELGPKREELKEKVARLNFFSNTFIPGALRDGIQRIKLEEGAKHIIVVSDGGSPANHAFAYESAGNAKSSGINVHTIGVGVELQSDTRFLKDLAKAGGGVYFEPSEASKVKIIFESYEEGEGDLDGPFPLQILNSHHFITQGLDIDANIAGYNAVIPKSGSELLVTTTSSRPVLTVWRYGLGRVAAISTDDGRNWAGEMLNKKNSPMLTRTINWAIGDIGRNKEQDVKIKDTFYGNQIEAQVRSPNFPSDSRMTFSKIDQNLYIGSAETEEIGFDTYMNVPAAVNYAEEVQILGQDKKLENLVKITRGAAFFPSDINSMVEKIELDSRRIETGIRPVGWWFAVAALLIFLIEIIIRRIRESKILNT